MIKIECIYCEEIDGEYIGLRKKYYIDSSSGEIEKSEIESHDSTHCFEYHPDCTCQSDDRDSKDLDPE